MLKYLFFTAIICFIINMPIGYALGVASMAFVILNGLPVGQWVLVPQRIAMSINSFPLLAIPYFMVAGAVMEMGGVSRRIINLASAIVGHIKGGVASASIISCAIFAAISGSTPATAAAIGSITIPEMVKRRYPADYSSAVVASSACLGVIIPPSITMVIFATTCNVSVGKTLIGGILPGIVLAIMLCITNYFFCRKAGYETEPKQSGRAVWLAFKDAVWALLMPVIILGGIYGGIFTPTESAVVAIVYSLIIGVFVYKELDLKGIYATLRETVLINGQTTFLVGLSLAFARYLTMAQVPAKVAGSILNLSSPILILLMINLLLLVIGCFIDNISSTVILTPILLPIVTGLGMSPIQFGIVMTVNLAIGFITPPYGANLFYASAVGKVSIERIAAKIMPMIAVMLVVLLALTFIPQISLGLLSLR
jgi:C4-dicarboxylate transporter DctM subunit